MNYSVNSVQGSSIRQESEIFSKPLRGRHVHSWFCLLYFIMKAFSTVHLWTNQSLIEYSIMETACTIQMNFQTVKWLMLILYILGICLLWQILFMIPNLLRDMAMAALHFSLRMTSFVLSVIL